MLEVVRRLVGCETASYNEIDLLRGTAKITVSGAAGPDPAQAAVFADHAMENPLVAYQSSTGDPVPRRLSDFITGRQFHRRPIYALVYGALGIETQLACGLDQAGPGSDLVGLALNRGPSDFSERDVAVIETLRPLLSHIRLSLPACTPLPESLAAELDGAGLTPRQHDVMSLLARGATNQQIAVRLLISERTVAKHLEHAFRRLGVTNRTAAAAAWRRTRPWSRTAEAPAGTD
jgi:DNA-binding CsgD family transcriptional regulator